MSLASGFSAAERKKKLDDAEKAALNIKGKKGKKPRKPKKPKGLSQTAEQKAKIEAARKTQKLREEKARQADRDAIAAMGK